MKTTKYRLGSQTYCPRQEISGQNLSVLVLSKKRQFHAELLKKKKKDTRKPPKPRTTLVGYTGGLGSS